MRPSRQISVRQMLREDVPQVAAIFRDAFNEIYERRGFGPLVPDASVGAAVAQAYRTLDPDGCLVVMLRGKVVGSGFLHVRGGTAGAGPITVDPAMQGHGAGRALVADLCRRADAAGVRSLRLIQDAFNEVSFALYSREGFVVRETLARASFRSRRGLPVSAGIRRARADDVAAIVYAEAARIGIERSQDYEMLLRIGDVFLAGEGASDGSLARIVRGGVAVLGPASAASIDTLLGLIAAATSDLPPRTDTRLLLPTRDPELFGRLFALGLEVHSLCTYMVRGEYSGPGCFYVPTLFPESG